MSNESTGKSLSKRKAKILFDGSKRESLFHLDHSLDDLGVATSQALKFRRLRVEKPVKPAQPEITEDILDVEIDWYGGAEGRYRQELITHFEHQVGRYDVYHNTIALLKGFAVMFNFFEVRKEITESGLQQFITFLENANTLGEWQKLAKYLLTFPLAKFLKNPTPPQVILGGVPIPFVPKGLFRKWFKAHLNAFNAENVKLWYTWYNLKRCALPPDDTVLAAAYESHMVSLTRDDPVDIEPSVADEMMDMPIVRSFLETIAREFSDQLYSSELSGKSANYRPSNNAALAYSRAKGGQLASVRGFIQSQRSSGLELPSPEFYSMEMVPHAIVNGKKTNSLPISRYKTFFDRWDDLDVLVEGNIAERTERYNGEIPPSCEIYGIPEPLKIRIISKGPGEEYFLAKPLQKALHTVLRKKPQFALIGEKFREEHLTQLRNPKFDNWDGDEKLQWLSIDYSSATDYLSANLSRRVVDSIVKYLGPEKQRAFRRTLEMHEMLYCFDKPELECVKSKKDGTYQVRSRSEPVAQKVMQRNGQLMGSPLSFPLLCLCNFILYLYATRELHARLGLTRSERLSSVLVNGDDMLYVGRKSDFDYHTRCGLAIGLTMSPGKAYVNEKYANINSTSVICDIKSTGVGRIIPFFNIGLLFGIHKTGTVSDNFGKLNEDPEMSTAEDTHSPKGEQDQKGVGRSPTPKKEGKQAEIAVQAEAMLRQAKGEYSSLDRDGQNCLALEKMMAKLRKSGSRRVPVMDRRNLIAILNRRDNIQLGAPNYVSIINEVLSSAGHRLAPKVMNFMLTWNYTVRKIQYDTTCLVKGAGPKKIWTIENRNLFIPESCGGMGVKIPHSFKTKVLPMDRAIANHMIIRGGGNFEVERPFRRRETYLNLEPLDHLITAPWDVKPVPDGKLTTFNLKTDDLLKKSQVVEFIQKGCFVNAGRYRKVVGSKKRSTIRLLQSVDGQDLPAEFD